MARFNYGSAIRRVALLSLVVVMVLTFFSGCGTTGGEATEPEETDQPTPMASVEATQTPAARSAVPDDLFSDELNVFSDVSFPDGYSVYAAGFENDVSFSLYNLYLTAEGDPEEIITYMSNLLGDDAEESIRQNIDYYNDTGAVSIYGTQVEKGLLADCEIAPTEEDTYDYDYVEGCTILLRAPINDTTDYDKVIEDNYNLNSLSDVAEYFDLMPISGRSEIYVRKHRNNVQIDVVYDTLEDVAGIMDSMKTSMTYGSFDESINILRPEDYGEVSNEIYFDLHNNTIIIFQNLSDSSQNYKDYKTATTA